MNQIERNKTLAKSFSELIYCGYNHIYQTRSVARKLFDILYVKTDAYGTHSAKHHYIIDWSNFKKTFSNLSPANHKPQNQSIHWYWSSLEKHRKTTILQQFSVSLPQPILFLRTTTYGYSINIIIICDI